MRLFPFTDRALRGELYYRLQFSIVAAMSYVSDVPAETVFSIVVACWLGFGAIVVIGKKGASKTEKEKDFRSHAGFLLQCIAYAICLMFHRRYFSSFMAMPRAAELILSAVAIAIAVVSEWFCFVAARALGKQWALVTGGPGARTREPGTLLGGKKSHLFGDAGHAGCHRTCG